MKNLKKIFKIFIIRFGLIFFADSDHSDLKEELDKSRLNFSPIEYKSYSLILSLILGIITPIIVFLIFQHIIIASFFILLIPILYIAAVLYPAMYSSIRKDRIENNLYNSISYMYSLYSTNTTFKKIFTEIAESEAEFEEISIEAKEIIKYIEMGYSAVSAIRKVQKTTPSIEFSEFLDNLIQIQSTGGDVEKYLKNKTEEYKDLEKDKTEKFIQKVEMIGQFYIIGVGLAPILFLMMAVMLHSLKPTPKEFLYIATYVWIPIGTTIVTIILSQNTGQQSSVDLFESVIINYFDFKKKVIHYLKQPLTS
ncbi:MAG: type II secretion system F family protein, partial [archaeon]